MNRKKAKCAERASQHLKKIGSTGAKEGGSPTEKRTRQKIGKVASETRSTKKLIVGRPNMVGGKKGGRAVIDQAWACHHKVGETDALGGGLGNNQGDTK